MDLKNILKNRGVLREEESLSKHTTYKIGGKARWLFEPESEEDMVEALNLCKREQIPFIILGKGSNVLFSDDPFEGLVISTARLGGMNFEKNGVEVQAGASLIALAYQCLARSLGGFEFISGIPGSVGGGLYMNAGAYKSALADYLKAVKVWRNGKVEWIDAGDLDFGYRHSSFQEHPDWIVLAARFELEPGDPERIRSLIESRKARRESSQPVHQPCAGSVFRNPEQMAAWQIVDELGFRGKKVGGARVSDLHSNFIVNEGGASARDVLELISQIQQQAREKYQIDLVCEVERIDLREESQAGQ